jgi:copper chaperone CopZ
MNTHITKTYAVKGMHCASCAGIIEKTFKKTDGVESVEVNYGTEKAKIVFDSEKVSVEEQDREAWIFSHHSFCGRFACWVK